MLDDPLSAVDAHVSKHIFSSVISSKNGLLKNKVSKFAKINQIWKYFKNTVDKNTSYKFIKCVTRSW